MNFWKVILATLVIFGTGVVTGGLLVHTVESRRPPEIAETTHPVILPASPATNPPAVDANPWQVQSKNLLRRMDRELALTPEQHAHIERLIVNSAERTRMLWQPIAPKMRKEMSMVRDEIRDILTPSQQLRFDDINKPRLLPEKRRPPGPGPRGDSNSISSKPAAWNHSSTTVVSEP